MNFGSALANLKEGRKVARREWDGTRFLIVVKSAEANAGPFYPFIQSSYGVMWHPEQSDLFAEDWQVIP